MTRFSILTPTKDRPLWLSRCMLSVVDQRFEDWEQIVYDNGEQPVEHLIPEDSRIRYHRGPAEGNADAFNRALELAQGEIITPLSDDDRLTPDALSTVTGCIEGHRWLVGLTSFEDEAGVEQIRLGGRVRLDRLRRKYYLGGAVYWRRNMTDELGGFDTDFEQAADYDLYLRFAERTEFGGLANDPPGGPAAGFVNRVLYRCTDHSGTDSNVHNERQRDATRRIKAKGAAAAEQSPVAA